MVVESTIEEICGLMSYANRKQMSSNRTAAIVIVALIHVALGYALVSGLAYNVVKKAAEDLKTFDVEDEPPPPPEEPPPPPEQTDAAAAAGSRAAADRADQHRRAADHLDAGCTAAGDHAARRAGPAGSAGSAASEGVAGRPRQGQPGRRCSRPTIIRSRRSAMKSRARPRCA